MSKAAAVRSISSAGKAGELDGDSDFPVSEKEHELSGRDSVVKINLGLNLGGFYGEGSRETPLVKKRSCSIDREIKRKCISLNRSLSLPANGAVESVFTKATLSGAMENLKSNAFPNLSSQESSPITNGNKVETPLIMLEKTLKRANVVTNDTNVTYLNMVKIMPRVTTKGDKPNGKLIEGFLSSYMDIGNIKIVCNCHGKIMSPSEFIKHAGGTGLNNPMKYIKVMTIKLDN